MAGAQTVERETTKTEVRDGFTQIENGRLGAQAYGCSEPQEELDGESQDDSREEEDDRVAEERHAQAQLDGEDEDEQPQECRGEEDERGSLHEQAEDDGKPQGLDRAAEDRRVDPGGNAARRPAGRPDAAARRPL